MSTWNCDTANQTTWRDNDDRSTWWIFPCNELTGEMWRPGETLTHFRVELAMPWDVRDDGSVFGVTWIRAVTRTTDEAILLIESGDIDKIAERIYTEDEG